MNGPIYTDYDTFEDYVKDIDEFEVEAESERDWRSEQDYNENELYSLRANILAQVVRLERQISERLEMSASKLTPLIIMTYQAKLDVLASIGLHLPRIEEMRKALKNHN
jgi:hypothetical protein